MFYIFFFIKIITRNFKLTFSTNTYIKSLKCSPSICFWHMGRKPPEQWPNPTPKSNISKLCTQRKKFGMARHYLLKDYSLGYLVYFKKNRNKANSICHSSSVKFSLSFMKEDTVDHKHLEATVGVFHECWTGTGKKIIAKRTTELILRNYPWK